MRLIRSPDQVVSGRANLTITPVSVLPEKATTVVLCLVDYIYSEPSPYSSPNLCFR